MKYIQAVTVLIFISLASATLSSQTITIPLRASDNGGHFDTLWFGQDPGASYCLDPALGESEVMPKPPLGTFDVRWVESREGSTCFGQGTKRDYRPDDDTYLLNLQAGSGGYPFTLSWGDLSQFIAKSITLQDVFNGTFVNVDMKSQSGVVISSTLFSALFVTVGSGPPPVPLAPSASTWETFLYGQTSAALSAGVNPNGSVTDCWFEWGTTDSYGQTTLVQSVGAGTQYSEFTLTISGLLPGNLYHYRVAAQNSAGTTYGEDRTVTTVPAGIAGRTLFPLTVTDNQGRTKTLWLGVDASATYCIDPWMGERELPPVPPVGTFDARFAETRQFSACLGTGTGVDFREYVDPGHGDLYRIDVQPGDDGDPITLSWPDLGAWFAGTITLRDIIDGSILNIDMKSRAFYTVDNPLISSFYIVSGTPDPQSPAAPFAVTHGAEFTTQSSSFLTGAAVPAGDSATAWFEWGQTSAYGNSTAPRAIGDGESYVSVTSEITGLYPAMVHHYRIVAQNSIGTTYGADRSFMTIPDGIPGVTLFSLDVADHGSNHKLLWLGVVPGATSCIDEYVGEAELPPVPPSGVFDARSVGYGPAGCLGQGLIADFRDHATDTQVDTFVVAFQPAYSGDAVDFAWDDLSAYFSGAARMTDLYGGLVVDVDMTAQTAYAVDDARIRSLLIVTGPAPSLPPIPAAITAGALSVSQTEAMLSGSVNPRGFETSAWFEYGPTAAYGFSTTPRPAGNGTAVIALTQPAAGLDPGTLYHYRIAAENVNGVRTGPDMVFTTGGVTAAEEPGTVPARFGLIPNYPNPFNPSTAIGYSLPAAGNVRISVYNLSGEKVAVLVDGHRGAGSYEVEWNAGDAPSGVYYCRMSAGSFRQTLKLMLLR